MSYAIAKGEPTRNFSLAAMTMVFLGTLFYFYEYYLRVAPSVMKADLQERFFLSEAAFGYLIAFYFIAYTTMQIPVGMLMDRFGPKRVLTLACGLCALGALLFATSSHLYIAQLAQFLIGLGSAFAYVGVLKISDDWLAPQYFAFIAGLCNTLGMLGAISGEMISEYLLGVIGWQSTLLYAAIIGIFLTAVLWFILHDGNPRKKYHFQSTIPSLPQPSVLNGLFVVAKHKQIWLTGLIGCLTYMPIAVFAGVWAPDYLMNRGFEKASAAFGSSLIFFGFAFGAPFWGYISDLIKSRRLPLILGSFLAALCLFLLIWLPFQAPLAAYLCLFFIGFFIGVEILIFAIGNDWVPSSICATAAAFINMMTMVGAIIFPPLIGKLLDLTVSSSASKVPSIENYATVLMVLPLGLVMAGILSFLLKESYPKNQ